jgi:hypothetical protein
MRTKFFVLAALAAMILAAAAPVAFAHGGQEGLVGPQPVEWTGEEATITGLLEPAGQKLDGTPVWATEDETSGTFYHVEQGEGVGLAAFEGQRVSLHGELGHLEGAVILVDSVEQLQDETGKAPGEEFSGTGIVEYLDDKADGTPVYGLSVSPEEGHYMAGDFDFAAFEGEQVNVTGQIVSSYGGGGGFLQVESIEPVGVEGGEQLQAVKQTVPGASPETAESGDEVAEETVAVELASEETPVTSEPGETADRPGALSAAVKALPVTGGMALLLPLAGLVLAAAGLAAYRMIR